MLRRAFEDFNTVGGCEYPYWLSSKTVNPRVTDCVIEAEAEQWIRTSPEAFCHQR